MKSSKVIKIIEDAGWFLDRITGSHHIFKHDTLIGIVVVPHPKKSLPTGTLKSIEKQAGVRLR